MPIPGWPKALLVAVWIASAAACGGRQVSVPSVPAGRPPGGQVEAMPTAASVPPEAPVAAASAAEPAPASSSGSPAERAREVLDRHCGRCHNGRRETALPRALAVYDLARDDWYVTLTEPRLLGALSRLERRGSSDPGKVPVPPEELEVFRAFVDWRRREVSGEAPEP